jgi:hypothetical protein
MKETQSPSATFVRAIQTRVTGLAAQGTRAVLLILRTDTAAAAFNQRLGHRSIRDKT